jgi:hypothetical protein
MRESYPSLATTWLDLFDMDNKVADNKERESCHVDDVDDSAFEKDIAADSGPVEEFDPERSSRILRAVDIRLLPVLTVLYLISFIDRSNSMCTCTETLLWSS